MELWQLIVYWGFQAPCIHSFCQAVACLLNAPTSFYLPRSSLAAEIPSINHGSLMECPCSEEVQRTFEYQVLGIYRNTIALVPCLWASQAVICTQPRRIQSRSTARTSDCSFDCPLTLMLLPHLFYV